MLPQTRCVNTKWTSRQETEATKLQLLFHSIENKFLKFHPLVLVQGLKPYSHLDKGL